MNEPWINPEILTDILGGTGGTLGAIVGILASVFIPKGKAKKLVLGVDIFACTLSGILLAVGIIAYLSGQPYDVWYGFGLCGLIGTPLFGMLFFVFRTEYKKAELRKAMSEDIIFRQNTDNE